MLRHFTASVFVTYDHAVLLLLHRTKRLWLPPGGHLEPNEEPADAALREVMEETGLRVVITSPRVPADASGAAPRPEACLAIPVAEDHIHIDLVYFATLAPGSDPAHVHPNDEGAALHWWKETELRQGRPALSPAVAKEAAPLPLQPRRSAQDMAEAAETALLPPTVQQLALRALAEVRSAGRA